MSAYEQGVKAYWEGAYITHNPYEKDTSAFKQWAKGYGDTAANFASDANKN